jgi:type IV pilus assembly protein PilB
MQTTYLTREQLDEAIGLQKQAQEGRLGEWLLRLGFVEEHQVTSALARQFGLPLINLRNSSANADAVRMIPGKVAKSSGFLPVGFDDEGNSIRVAVCAPVDFLSQQAIQRMVQKGIRVYVGDQSRIQQLLGEWYIPEDLDLSSVPTFSSVNELMEVGNEIVATAIENRAEDIRAELLQDFFWVRLDYASESHHYFFRYTSAPVEDLAPTPGNEFLFNYAVGH